METKVELGDEARDTITGFKGKVVAITEWLHGCRRVVIQPTDLDKEGRIKLTETFDEAQVKVTKPVKVKKVKSTKGGPRPNAERQVITR